MKIRGPVITYDEEIFGAGTVTRGGRSVRIIRFSLIRQKYDPRSRWDFRGTTEELTQAAWHVFLSPGSDPISFSGQDDAGQPVRIRVLHFRSQSGRELVGSAQTVETGLEEIDGKIKSQYMEIHLWPTPFALPETDVQAQFFTGEIKRIGAANKNRPPKMELALGAYTLRLSRQYSWEKAIVGESESMVRVPRPTLSGKLRVRQRAISPASVANDIAEDLEDVTALLSFLSRRHVRWSRITLHSMTGSEVGRRFETYQRIRGSPSSHRKRDEEPLLTPRALPNDALAVLSKAFKALNRKDMCKSAILYLLGARDSSFIDERIANSYTAFEAALGASTLAATSEFTMNAAAFKSLASRLRATVDAFAKERDLPPEVSEAVYAKLPELRRRPIVDRAIEQLSKLRIQSTDLWPASVGTKLGMSALYKRRNRFIHSGHLESIDQVSADADRLIVLTERLLLSLLPIDPKWMNPWANPELRYLQQTSEPVSV